MDARGEFDGGLDLLEVREAPSWSPSLLRSSEIVMPARMIVMMSGRGPLAAVIDSRYSLKASRVSPATLGLPQAIE